MEVKKLLKYNIGLNQAVFVSNVLELNLCVPECFCGLVVVSFFYKQNVHFLSLIINLAWFIDIFHIRSCVCLFD